ncbi:hypothetical protein BACPU_04280 [Bacillus pumilus]|nr:hypothetical protein BACPU_04280 [Bacillus pumilus]
MAKVVETVIKLSLGILKVERKVTKTVPDKKKSNKKKKKK